MSVKILFTADNHIGITYNSFPASKDLLVKERLNSFIKMIEYANQNGVHFFIVGGDLFDKTTVNEKQIKAVATALNTFSGDLVIIIPGNHDFFEEADQSLWSKFNKWADGEKVVVLSNYETFNYELNDKIIHFFPAGCRSLHSNTNMIGWVRETEKKKEHLNIGIAHGNVSGLGLDEKDRYFNMTPDELSACELDFWLLGHIHVPFPNQDSVTQNPGIFMAGTHMPDSWKYSRDGNAWVIEMDEHKNVSAKKFKPSGIKINEITHCLYNQQDLDMLNQLLNGYDKENTALKLTLTGNLDEDTAAKLQDLLSTNSEAFMELHCIHQVGQKIDEAFINKLYSTDSLPHSLLTELYREDPEGDAVQKAFQILKKIQKS